MYVFIPLFIFFPPPLPPCTGWLTSYPPRRFASGIASAYSEILFLWGRKKKNPPPSGQAPTTNGENREGGGETSPFKEGTHAAERERERGPYCLKSLLGPTYARSLLVEY